MNLSFQVSSWDKKKKTFKLDPNIPKSERGKIPKSDPGSGSVLFFAASLLKVAILGPGQGTAQNLRELAGWPKSSFGPPNHNKTSVFRHSLRMPGNKALYLIHCILITTKCSQNVNLGVSGPLDVRNFSDNRERGGKKGRFWLSKGVFDTHLGIKRVQFGNFCKSCPDMFSGKHEKVPTRTLFAHIQGLFGPEKCGFWDSGALCVLSEIMGKKKLESW